MCPKIGRNVLHINMMFWATFSRKWSSIGPFSVFSHTQQIVWRVESRLQFSTTLPLTYVRESGKIKHRQKLPPRPRARSHDYGGRGRHVNWQNCNLLVSYYLVLDACLDLDILLRQNEASYFLDYFCIGLSARSRIGAGNRLWHRLYHGVLDETWRPLRCSIEQRFEEED